MADAVGEQAQDPMAMIAAALEVLPAVREAHAALVNNMEASMKSAEQQKAATRCHECADRRVYEAHPAVGAGSRGGLGEGRW